MFLYIRHLLIYDDFTFNSDLKNTPFSIPKSSKIVSPTFKNRPCFFHCFFSGFSIDFGSIWVGFWEALGRLWGSKIQKNAGKTRAKCGQNAGLSEIFYLECKMAPKSSPRAPLKAKNYSTMLSIDKNRYEMTIRASMYVFFTIRKALGEAKKSCDNVPNR